MCVELATDSFQSNYHNPADYDEARLKDSGDEEGSPIISCLTILLEGSSARSVKASALEC